MLLNKTIFYNFSELTIKPMFISPNLKYCLLRHGKYQGF